MRMTKKFLAPLVFGLALVGNVETLAARPAAQLKQAVAHNSWGTRLLNKAITWGAIVFISSSAITGDVLAQDSSTTQSHSQVRQSYGTAEQRRVLPRTPLHEMIKQLDYDTPEGIDYERIAGMLAAGEVDVNAKDVRGNTALHLVAKDFFYEDNYDNAKLTKLILAYNADPNLRNYERKTPLSYALESWFCCVDRKAVEMARLLVAAGADLHKVDYRGRADNGLAIHNALEAAAILVTERHAFTAVLEKEAGGIVQVVREQGEHLLKLAAEWSNTVVVEALLDYGVDADVGMFGAVLSQQRELPRQMVMGMLISRGADINVKDAEQGDTPLHIATTEGKLHNVKILLERRAERYS